MKRSDNYWNSAAPTESSAAATGRLPKDAERVVRGVSRRWFSILLAFSIFAGAGIAYTLLQKPVYRASARLLIEPPRTLMSMEGERPESIGYLQNFYQTRVEMIASRQIAERVMAALEMSQWAELRDVKDPVGTLVKWIEVTPVKNSNLVDVAIEGTDPELTAKLVNTTAEEFIRYEQETLQQFNHLSRQQIDTELRALDQLLENSKRALAEFLKKRNSGFLVDGEDIESAKLVVLEQARSEADLRLQNARRALARFEQLLASGVPFLSEVSAQETVDLRKQVQAYDDELALQREVLTPARFQSDVAIRRLREKRDELQAMVDEVGTRDAQYETLRLQHEVTFAEQDLAELEKLVAAQRTLVVNQQDDHNTVATLRSENDRLTELHNFIAKRRLEVEMRQSLIAPRVQIHDRAELPRFPTRPVYMLQIPLCLFLALFVGFAVAWLRERADQSIRSTNDLRNVVHHLPIIGVLPQAPSSQVATRGTEANLATMRPGSSLAEAFRSLRSSLIGTEADLLSSPVGVTDPVDDESPTTGAHDSPACPTLLITSARAGEGKSVVARNLAAACARAGESVLLIDVDFRAPTVGRHFRLPSEAPGLADVLAGSVTWEEALAESIVPNLTVLPAGAIDHVPADILGTIEMQELLQTLAGRFDRLILDGAALLGCADARVLGRFVDHVLLVVREGRADAASLARTLEVAEQVRLPLVGVIYNGCHGRHVDLVTTPAKLFASPKRRQTTLVPRPTPLRKQAA